MAKMLLALLLLVTAPLTQAADAEFPGIETLMTTDELQSAGIDSLSASQIEALNAWIERYTNGTSAAAVTAPVTTSAAAVVPATPATAAAVNPAPVTAVPLTAAPEDNFRQASEKIDFVSRIAGKFEGWSGRTRFTLENGQVWEQRRGNRWKISLDSPEVRIRQNFMRAFEMEVLSEGRSIGVRRIR